MHTRRVQLEPLYELFALFSAPRCWVFVELYCNSTIAVPYLILPRLHSDFYVLIHIMCNFSCTPPSCRRPLLSKTHVAPGTLRVCVLDRMDPRVAPSPSMLAWDYDVVITTFNRLSFAKPFDPTLLGAAAVASSGGGGSGNAWSNALSKVGNA